MDEKFYTPKEVAALLKVSYMTVFRWIKAGKLVAVKVGKQYRIQETYLNKFVNSKVV